MHSPIHRKHTWSLLHGGLHWLDVNRTPPEILHMKFSQPIMVSIIQAVKGRLIKILVCHLDELLVFAGHS